MTPAARHAPPKVLVVIPARGGSKGIPRKNLRPLRGKPLIAYPIATARASRFRPDVYVSSEDGEILSIAAKLGALVHRRSPGLARDETTLDDVVHEAVSRIEKSRGKRFDVVVTLQATSPLLKTSTLDEAIEALLADASLHSVISAVDDTHLTWTKRDGRFVPNYQERVNRQYLDPIYRETGGFLIARRSAVTPDGRTGENVALCLVSGAEAVDIDTLEDFQLCEWYLTHRKILFVVSGYPAIGLGHVHNALTLATDLVRHSVSFLVDRKSALAYDVLGRHNYPVHRQEHDDLLKDVARLHPEVVISDRLDTSARYVLGLKRLGAITINFEDLGPGARHADLVINAIYPERTILPNHYFGHRYFCAQAEFLMTEPNVIEDQVRRVLVTFGGTDPNNLTCRVLRAISGYCRERGIAIDVVLGTGYQAFASLEEFDGIRIEQSVPNMSDFMRAADVIFTSAGRTVFEIACIGTPAIVLAQNRRELTHLFASEEHGFVNLGLGSRVEDAEIRAAFTELVDQPDSRRHMHRLMLDNELRSGKERVLDLIHRTIGD